MIEFREARPNELEGWDDLTVRPVGGHVMQSRAWGESAARAGWQPHYLVGADGSAILALRKPWPVVAGGHAHIPGGPVPTADPATLADRLAGVTRWLVERDVDVVANEPLLPASSGYAGELARVGYQPPIASLRRHRVVVPLGPDLDEGSAFERLSARTRDRIREDDGHGLRVVRFDRSVRRTMIPADFAKPEREIDWSFAYFHVMLQSSAEGQSFEMLSRLRFLDWAHTSYEARHTIYLEAMNKRAQPVAGLVLHRHGDRFSTFLEACLDTTPDQWPGAFDLLRWRAMQLAIRAGMTAIDLDGAGATGFRPDLAPIGFGAESFELTGAHEFVARRRRYRAGLLAARAAERIRPKPAT